jgi:hypothetical protein
MWHAGDEVFQENNIGKNLARLSPLFPSRNSEQSEDPDDIQDKYH